ncbi:MAG: hypothetical protein ACFFCS_13405 [Candidatus Hodarchaeota archaeon]
MLPISTCHKIGLSLIFTVVITGAIMTFYLIKKYLTVKKTVLMKLLVYTFIPLMIAVASDPISFIISRFFPTIDQANDFVSFLTSITFCFTALANIFFARFLARVFQKNEGKKIWVLIITAAELCVIVGLPTFTGLKNETGQLIFLLLHIAISLSLYIYQSFRSFTLARKTKEILSKNALKSITASGLLLIGTLVMFMIQEIAFMMIEDFKAVGLIDDLGCSLFIPIGWTLAILSTFSLFIGYYVPGWVKRRWRVQYSTTTLE